MHRARPDQRRILRAALAAAVLSGAPSTACALVSRGPAAAAREGWDATRAIGVLTGRPGHGRPGLVRGAVAHLAVSVAVGELLALGLPRRGTGAADVGASALAGLAIGWVNLAVIAPRFYPSLAQLPLGPQLADNAAFGAVFAAIATP